MKLIGELIEVISRRAGLDNVREVGESLKTGRRSADATPRSERLGERVTDLLDVFGSDLLDFGQMVIAGMKKTTGEGSPDTGARFGHGHSGFNKAGETLGSAGPNDNWDGQGSRAYADQNTRQQLRTETLADADLEVHRVLFREAAQITLRRGFLDDQSNFLAYTSYATFPLQFIPRYGEAAKLALEMSALQGALGESAYQLYQLHSEVSDNATELQQAIGRYSSVVDGAELPGAGTEFTPPLPPPDSGPPIGTVPPAPPVTSGGGIGAASGAGAPGAPSETVMGPMLLPDLPTVPPTPTPVAGAPTPAAGAPAALGSTPAGAAGPLGALIGPLAGLLTGAAIAAGQRAAASGQNDRPDDGERTDAEHEDDDKAKEQAEDVSAAASGGSGTERAPSPVEADSDTDGLQAPLTAKLIPDTSPVPTAGTSPQDKK